MPKVEELSDRQLAEWNYRLQIMHGKYLKTIRDILIFFVVLTALSIIGTLIIYNQVSYRQPVSFNSGIRYDTIGEHELISASTAALISGKITSLQEDSLISGYAAMVAKDSGIYYSTLVEAKLAMDDRIVVKDIK